MININLQKFTWVIIIFTILVILISIFPLYNYPFEKTINNNNQIIIYSEKSLNKSDWFITIDWQTKQDIIIKNWLNYLSFNIWYWQKISFYSKEVYNNIYLFVQLTGNIIKIYPQSAIYIDNIWNKQNITIINWKLSFLNLDNNNQIVFSWENKPIILDINDEILNKILQDQKNNQKARIINIYWWNIILNRTFDYIIHNLILLLSKISPNNFEDNLQNYNKFKNYISNQDQNSIIWNNIYYKKDEKTNINKDIFKQFNKWLSKIINTF
jgi:hypothetical protein